MLPQKSLEREVAKENPKQSVHEKIRPISADRLEMKLGITPELDKKLARIKDLLSQRRQRAVSLEEEIDAMADLFLEKYDPIKKAERLLARTVGQAIKKGKENLSSFKQKKPSADTIHRLNLRDQTQCTYGDANGARCPQTRWTQMHHIRLRSQGGGHDLGNLQTLCFHHHKKFMKIFHVPIRIAASATKRCLAGLQLRKTNLYFATTFISTRITL